MHTRGLFPHADRAAWKPSMPKMLKKESKGAAPGKGRERGRAQQRRRGAGAAAAADDADFDGVIAGESRSRSLVTVDRRGGRPAAAGAGARSRAATPPARPSDGFIPDEVERGGAADAAPLQLPQPPAHPDAPCFRELCWLHELGADDLLSTLSLAYDVPGAVLQQVNALPYGSDLDELRAETLIVVPCHTTDECLRQCMALGEDAEFLRDYGERTTSGFRRRRRPPPLPLTSPASPAPPPAFASAGGSGGAVSPAPPPPAPPRGAGGTPLNGSGRWRRIASASGAAVVSGGRWLLGRPATAAAAPRAAANGGRTAPRKKDD